MPRTGGLLYVFHSDEQAAAVLRQEGKKIPGMPVNFTGIPESGKEEKRRCYLTRFSSTPKCPSHPWMCGKV